MPSLNVGDGYSGPLVGVMDYNFGNFFLEVTNAVARVDNGLLRETTATPARASWRLVWDVTDTVSDCWSGALANDGLLVKLSDDDEAFDSSGPAFPSST